MSATPRKQGPWRFRPDLEHPLWRGATWPGLPGAPRCREARAGHTGSVCGGQTPTAPAVPVARPGHQTRECKRQCGPCSLANAARAGIRDQASIRIQAPAMCPRLGCSAISRSNHQSFGHTTGGRDAASSPFPSTHPTKLSMEFNGCYRMSLRDFGHSETLTEQ